MPPNEEPGRRVWFNPAAHDLVVAGAPASVPAFHRQLDGYAPTPLVELPGIATELGVGRLFAKDESARLGLPAFKVPGVSYAVAMVLGQRLGLPSSDLSLPRLRDALIDQPPVEIVTATDGNHGRALARIAAQLGLPARIIVPAVLTDETVGAIRAEGATVIVVPDDYDAAVQVAASAVVGREDALLIQDTAWPGYERVPQWIVDGYATLFREIDDQLGCLGITGAALVSVPVGVGSLAQAAVTHYRHEPGGTRTTVLAVEPDTAACVRASLDAGRITAISTGRTVMNGLNCGTPSSLAWPLLRDGLDAAVVVSDEEAERAMRDLAAVGVGAGPSGAAALAGLRRLLSTPGWWGAGDQPFDPAAASIVLISTEGPTGPASG